MAFDFDLVVIGGGSGGVRAARVSAELGARVLLIEAGLLGGTCVNVGCIPKKLLFHAAAYGHDFVDSRGYGFAPREPGFDWPELIARKNSEIARLNEVYQRLLEAAGVELLFGRARLLDRHHAEVAGRRISARYFLIATGSTPSVADVPGREHGITSNEAFFLPRLPRRALLVGGGYIALEFASIFHGLGSQVQLVHRGEQVLRGFDRDVRDHLASELGKQGIAIRCGTQVESIERRRGELLVRFVGGAAMAFDEVLFATGRVPNTAGLGLAELGVGLGPQGAVETDGFARTAVDNIFAVGDCIGGFGLTPVAIAQGHALARSLFQGTRVSVDLNHVPTAVFSQPVVAVVGLPEHEARARYRELLIYRSVFTPLKHRLTGSPQQSLIKLVVDAETDRVLGCHMVGGDAAEIIQGFAVALKCGATKRQFDSVIGLHPTSAEEFVTLRTPV
jgi:glutathione reductase (NADPH)